MAYDVGTRQRYRHAVSAVTGLAALGVVTACGWVAGVAARDHQHDLDATLASEKVRAAQAHQAWRQWVARTRAYERAQAAEILAHPNVRTVWKKRPLRTVVDTRVVHVAQVGTGGTLTSASGGTSGSSGGGSSSGGGGGSSSHSSPPRHSSGGGSAPSGGGSSGGGSTNGGSSGGGSPAPPPPPPPPPPSHGS